MVDFLSALDWISALFFAVAIGLIALTPKELKIARALILIAATLFGARWSIWAIMIGQPWYIKAAVGALVGGFLFGALPPSLAWIRTKISEAPRTEEKAQPDDKAVPPIGSLRYVMAIMDIDARVSIKSLAGQIKVEIANDTDKLIMFHAVTRGNINGIAFDVNPVEFDGYVSPHKSTYLLSKRLTGLSAKTQNDNSLPSLKGIFEYELGYKYAEANEFSRLSEKGIEIDYFHPVKKEAPGTQKLIPITVFVYHQVEK